MRRVQVSKFQSRRDDPAAVLPLDPRDPYVLRAERLRARVETAKQSR
jgi:hypothetical protein